VLAVADEPAGARLARRARRGGAADQPGTSGPAIEVLAVNQFSSSANGNHFCNQNSAGANQFSAALVKDTATSGAYSGTFDLAKQVNLGMLDQCP